jgi:diguanylate cyclase (GGDEF)-like protein
MLDVDHFKSVNDRYGHAVGDKALRAVAETCGGEKRTADIAGRLGGEEFAIILPETNLAQGMIVADRICAKVAESRLINQLANFAVTISVGVAEAEVEMPGFEALLHAADQALYQAKSQGRNRTVAWRPASRAAIELLTASR